MVDWSDYVKNKIKEYNLCDVSFTKKGRLLSWLAKRNKCTLEDMKKEIYNLKDMVFAEKQERTHNRKKEKRFRCYFVYSSSKGRCYVIKFNEKIKIITAFPLGRTTLRRYKKRFKY
ncbi:hypothetical protein JW949_03640 [Candidatus Woesearchaeota archaeon]|nr:hypothetical protein [Candidatus Woesearchaeota archaeon]